MGSVDNDRNYQRIAAELAAGSELRLHVDGVSMMPLIRPGDVVTVTPASWHQLACGDVVAVRRPAGDIVSHRIIVKSDTAVVTKGDNMRVPDPVWSADDVLGRVVALERDGTRINLRAQRGRTAGWLVSRLSYIELLVFRVARWFKHRAVGQKRISWTAPLTRVLQLPFRIVRRIVDYVN